MNHRNFKLILLTSIVLSLSSIQFLLLPSLNREYSLDDKKNTNKPEVSYPVPFYIQWVVSYEFIIDNTGATIGSITWERTVNSYQWASGKGTEENPYKIRYVLFNGRGYHSGLTIKNSDVYFIIEYCGFINSSLDYVEQSFGLYLDNVENGVIRNVFFHDNGRGIRTEESNNNIISSNYAFNNRHGFDLSGSNNIYSNNTAFLNDNDGFHIFGSNNTITQNEAYNNSFGFTTRIGVYNLVYKNIAYNNKEDGFYLGSDNMDVINNTAYGNKRFGILIYNSEGLNLTLNRVYGNKEGIGLGYGYNISFSVNSIYGNLQNGISLYSSDDNNINNNLITHNYQNGIKLIESENNYILNNSISSNINNGIHLSEDSSSNKIFSNTIFDQAYGIYVDSRKQIIKYNEIFQNDITGLFINNSRYSNITGNTIYDNSMQGIQIENAGFNTFLENIISYHEYYGVEISNNSDSNMFYRNQFISNQIHALSNDISTSWNFSGKGNYWDDYVGVDRDDDGYGEIPYLILGLGNNADFHPIFDDGKDIQIDLFSPDNNSLFGRNAPFFNISIYGPNISSTWYTLNGMHPVTIFPNSSGIVDPTIWNFFGSGDLILKYCVNDTSNKLQIKSLNIEKDITPPILEVEVTDTYGVTRPFYEIPVYKINLIEDHPHKVWYSIDGGVNNISVDFSRLNMMTIINEQLWYGLDYGLVNITFYSEDLVGNFDFVTLEIEKIAKDYQVIKPKGISGEIILVYSLLGTSIVLISLTMLYRKIRHK